VPVLFTGTMRDNLDPFGKHTDAEIWAALRRAHLAPVVENSPQVQLCNGAAARPATRKLSLAAGLGRRIKRSSPSCALQQTWHRNAGIRHLPKGLHVVLHVSQAVLNAGGNDDKQSGGTRHSCGGVFLEVCRGWA
jgi:hypothetical protein